MRDSKRLSSKEPYPVNEMPDELIRAIGAHLVYLMCTGRNDISGEDWGDAFAEAIGGKHLDSPLGIADVVAGDMAWSLKTVKKAAQRPGSKLRLISGRCSPDYSYGIGDPHQDIDRTGRAVLNIWNERVNIARDSYRLLRTAVLVRSDDLLSYCLFEEEPHRFRTNDYTWETNRGGNFIGKEIATGETRFTWQPHGSQFTIHTAVPAGAIRFSIRRPPSFPKQDILDRIAFDDTWVAIHRN